MKLVETFINIIFLFYFKVGRYSHAKVRKYVLLRYWSWKAKHECKSFVSFAVNGPTKLNKKTELGQNVNFNGLVIHGNGQVVIGNNFHSGIDCQFITSFHNYESTAIPYDNEVIRKSIIIEDNVWLGNDVIVLGGVRIGEGAIIQAGSVVVNDIPECAIAGGHPARAFKFRDKDHYFKLKAEGRFH